MESFLKTKHAPFCPACDASPARPPSPPPGKTRRRRYDPVSSTEPFFNDITDDMLRYERNSKVPLAVRDAVRTCCACLLAPAFRLPKCLSA